MTTKMILDCDPGHDDAIAILLALGSPQIDLLGITTIGGNHSLEKVTFNARAVYELADRPKVPGCFLLPCTTYPPFPNNPNNIFAILRK